MSIFISCVYEDSHRITSIQKWKLKYMQGDVIITHETEDKRNLGKKEIKDHVSKKIRGAAVIFVLVGNNTHNHIWIESEVELANSFHKKIICIRLPNTTGNIPIILKSFKCISFDPHSITKALADINQ